MDKGEDDDIRTPDTSRSNSINEDEGISSVSSVPPPAEAIIQSESSPPSKYRPVNLF
jgi:hypothetical protein